MSCVSHKFTPLHTGFVKELIYAVYDDRLIICNSIIKMTSVASLSKLASVDSGQIKSSVIHPLIKAVRIK